MSRKFGCIKDISDKKETWRLAVRIIDLWSVVNSKGAEHLEMVIMDDAGDRIQVLIRADHTDKWKSRIQENMTCIINNDIIGVVHEINNMQSNTPGKKTFVALSLKDLRYIFSP
ncbi:uncharacterized protein LOC131618843 [Vicia villosa]|uniref:uncharacterized protein LOC131618843 n=1 Tax=Vicia villosa TaxID=3911 RepID=UPI00273C57CE|nr:uncharacterized protein LOC131618843 [Vicia villosa]